MTSRRVELIPSKAFVASAENPAGPVTRASRPAGSPWSAISRTSSTAETSSFSSPPAAIGTLTTAAVPSSDHATGETPATPAISAWTSSARFRSTASRPPPANPAGARNTTTAGVCSPEGKPFDASSTRTDSASPGKKLDGSFF